VWCWVIKLASNDRKPIKFQVTLELLFLFAHNLPMKNLFLIAVTLFALAACSNAPEELKTPCVGAPNSPCDWRKPELNT
jgi:hypothetical protein